MTLQFNGLLEEIHRGSATSRTSRWVASDWYDRVLLAAPGSAPLFWAPGMVSARPIPGLPDSSGYDGVHVFNGHIVLWRDDLLKWSAKNDLSGWIPIPTTATTGTGILIDDLVAGEVSDVVGPVHLSEFSGELSAGQFVRLVSNETDPDRIAYDYFTVESFANAEHQIAKTLSFDQTVDIGATKRIYLDSPDYYVDWSIDSKIKIDGVSSELVITGKSRNQNLVYDVSDLNNNNKVPEVGGKTHVTLLESPEDLEPGDIVSIARSEEVGQDLYEVLQVSQTLTVRRLGIGMNLANPGTDIGDDETRVVFQHYVEVRNSSADAVYIGRNAELQTIYSAKLRTLAYTGATASREKIPAGSILESLDSNDAGELTNAGSRINGAILGVTTLAEFAYILKEWSIQSIQDVGPDQGTFYLRTEINDEGLFGRYAWTRFGDRSIAFIGHKAFYVYTGGQDLQPIATTQWDAFRTEVDRSRADEIVAYHNRPFSEVWFIYPTLAGETKVLIFNYEFNTITIDEYDSSLNGLTAVGMIEWELAPTWESLEYAEKFDGNNKRYYEYVDEGEQEYAVLAIGGDPGNADMDEDASKDIPRLLLHGRRYSRDSNDDCSPAAYECVAETPDFDWGDPAAFKYVDTVYLSLYVPTALQGPLTLEVYVGSRNNLDEAVTWSGPRTVSITGAGNGVTKINISASGRYHRLKFRSNTAGAKWAISAYRIMARMGGTW